MPHILVCCAALHPVGTNIKDLRKGFLQGHINHHCKNISSTTGHPSRWNNDKTITLHDKFLCNVQRKQQFNDYRFELNKKEDGTISKVQYNSVWLICDNGYPHWSCLIPPHMDPIYYTEFRFAEWIDSMRKDVECTFGILKGRFRVLKTGVRLHGIKVTDNIWHTCCALHNLFLEEDGLSDEWQNGTNIWESSWGDQEDSDVTTYAPSYLLERLTNPSSFDMTTIGTRNNVMDNEELELIDHDDMDHTTTDETTTTHDELPMGITDVNDLTMEEFRKRLTEHFDVLFQQKKLVWPKRWGEQQLHYQ
jgi:Plant transposon protein